MTLSVSLIFFKIHIVTARKRSLRRLCFYMCVSVHKGGMRGRRGGACVVGGHAWGGMCSRGACMGWHVWQGACMVGGMRGRGHSGGHAWGGWGVRGRGACVPWQISWDTVNERAVRILLECIPVFSCS